MKISITRHLFDISFLKYAALTVGFCLGCLNQTVFSQTIITLDKPTASYNVGQKAVFQITDKTNASLTYEIRYSDDRNLAVLKSGTVVLVNGKATIDYTLNEAGFIFCRVMGSIDTTTATASFAPLSISPVESEPADFDRFWDNQKAQLKAVPMNVQISFLDSTPYSTTYNFSINIGNGQRGYGYLMVPKGRAPYPAVIQLPSFGEQAGLLSKETGLCERMGVIVVYLSVHNNVPTVDGPKNYATTGLESPATFYYRNAMLSVFKSIDYLQTRTDFNGQVGAFGISQGGGLACLAAGLDNRISLLACVYPALGFQEGLKYKKPSAFPFYYRGAKGLNIDPEVALSTVKYYESVYAARRFKGISWLAVAYKDNVSPPTSVLAIFNQLKGEKIITHYFDKSHTQGPDAFFDSNTPTSVYAFYRRYFSATRRAPWPYNPTTLGYFIDAGSDISGVKDATDLSAAAGMEDKIDNTFNPKWEKVSGSGTVTFESPNSFNTRAKFSKIGDYVLRIVATDTSTLNKAEYSVLMDDLTVSVEKITLTNDLNLGAENLEITTSPNPVVDGFLKLSTTGDGLSTVSIFDVNGRLMLNKNLTAKNETLNLTEFPNGIYLLNVVNKNSLLNKKIVVNQR